MRNSAETLPKSYTPSLIMHDILKRHLNYGTIKFMCYRPLIYNSAIFHTLTAVNAFEQRDPAMATEILKA